MKNTTLIVVIVAIIAVSAFFVYAGYSPNSGTESGLSAIALGRCKDTCASSGYNCGIQTICKKSVNCGSCQTGYTCSAGKCIISDSCSDSDGGIMVATKGIVSIYSGGYPYSYTDFCVSNNALIEWYCSGTSAQVVNYTCSGNYTACSDGHCA